MAASTRFHRIVESRNAVVMVAAAPSIHHSELVDHVGPRSFSSTSGRRQTSTANITTLRAIRTETLIAPDRRGFISGFRFSARDGHQRITNGPSDATVPRMGAMRDARGSQMQATT